MSNATEDQIHDLHGKVAKIMSTTLDKLQEAANHPVTMKVPDEEGNEIEVPIDVKEPSPAFLSACISLIKHNDVTATVAETEELSDLEKALESRRSKKRPPPLAEVTHIDDHREIG